MGGPGYDNPARDAALAKLTAAKLIIGRGEEEGPQISAPATPAGRTGQAVGGGIRRVGEAVGGAAQTALNIMDLPGQVMRRTTGELGAGIGAGLMTSPEDKTGVVR